MTQPSALIFDLDGTLVHSVPDMHVSLNRVLAAMGRETLELTVLNHGDRPVQVGSHYPFFETNPALMFDRAKSFGMRLDIAAGTAVRFEPGESKRVRLVAIGGTQTIRGGNALTQSTGSPEEAIQKAMDLQFNHREESDEN